MRSWIPAVLWTILIFSLSSVPKFGPIVIRFRFMDKVAHAIEYGGLGFFLTVGYFGTLRGSMKKRLAALVVATGVMIGVCDELYQATVPGRSLEFFDWVADSIGVFLGNRLALFYYSRRRGGLEPTGGASERRDSDRTGER